MLLKRRLRRFNGNIKDFSFNGIKTWARVIRVIDGDTFVVLFERNGEMIQIRVRLNGCDCAEMRSKSQAEKFAAMKAKNFVKNLIENRIVEIMFLKNGKFGRTLGEIYIHRESLTDILIKERLAVKYDGGKKAIVRYDRNGLIRR